MIIARADQGDVQTLILGLSKMNVQKLLEGKPIHVARETHGDGIPEHWSIVIMAGETENSMAADLRRAGLLSNNTQIRKQPKNGD